MGNIIYLGVLIFLWVVLQYIIYIYIYYRYEICKEQKHIVIYRNSKFICYIVALIISICAITIFFKKYNSITMFKEIIFLRSIDAGKVILLFSINLIILVMLFVAESMLYGKQKLNIKKIVKIEFEKKNVEILDLITIVLVAPVIEEIVFRGLLYENLKIYHNTTMSVIFVGIAFGLVHIWPQKALFSFVASVIFSVGYIFAGVYLSIVCHVFYNFLSTYNIIIISRNSE